VSEEREEGREETEGERRGERTCDALCELFLAERISSVRDHECWATRDVPIGIVGGVLGAEASGEVTVWIVRPAAAVALVLLIRRITLVTNASPERTVWLAMGLVVETVFADPIRLERFLPLCPHLHEVIAHGHGGQHSENEDETHHFRHTSTNTDTQRPSQHKPTKSTTTMSKLSCQQ
jgi:hypothetical protein